MSFSEAIGDFYDVLGPFFEFTNDQQPKQMNGDVYKDDLEGMATDIPICMSSYYLNSKLYSHFLNSKTR